MGRAPSDTPRYPERVIAAVAMRKDGKLYKEIGLALGVAPPTVYMMLKRWAPDTVGPIPGRKRAPRKKKEPPPKAIMVVQGKTLRPRVNFIKPPTKAQLMAGR